ncbi:zinc-binding dehydrogenase [Halomonas sp. MMSF_3323]|uniref:zinc-binding dehydrogenase n=1 Tax=Halomonas sp. MMSF_3323 TaxID=3046701 RepID=UPI00273F7F08|nr:zinc-binding dehydrogenase [Halomonas sp. MMSF_3323]
MRAIVLRNERLGLESLPDPTPEAGEVLVKTLACGICGSDLHMADHCHDALAGLRKGRVPVAFEPDQGVVFGHEFCAEILDHGPGCDKRYKAGTRVCSVPYAVNAQGFHHIGYANAYPGGFGELMRLQEHSLLEVPGDLPSELAALTEPLAIGRHAVARARLAGGEVPIVIGCGPVGLSVVMALKAAGFGPVVATDFSPHRRQLAECLGADIVVDPAERAPFDCWLEAAEAPQGFDMYGPMAMLSIGAQPRPCVAFECVGVPGLIARTMLDLPPRSRLVVVGVCMQTDQIEPIVGIGKELDLSFSFGYRPEEFAATLTDLADGRLDAAPLITDRVTLDGVPAAFETLRHPGEHAKILIQHGDRT